MGHYEPHRIFAVPGEAARRPDGSSHIECTGTRATNLPVILRGGTGPLRRRELLPAREGSTRYRMARIRAVFHKSRYLITLHPASLEYPAYFDRATIVEALNQWCDLPEPPAS